MDRFSIPANGVAWAVHNSPPSAAQSTQYEERMRAAIVPESDDSIFPSPHTALETPDRPRPVPRSLFSPFAGEDDDGVSPYSNDRLPSSSGPLRQHLRRDTPHRSPQPYRFEPTSAPTVVIRPSNSPRSTPPNDPLMWSPRRNNAPLDRRLGFSPQSVPATPPRPFAVSPMHRFDTPNRTSLLATPSRAALVAATSPTPHRFAISPSLHALKFDGNSPVVTMVTPRSTTGPLRFVHHTEDKLGADCGPPSKVFEAAGLLTGLSSNALAWGPFDGCCVIALGTSAYLWPMSGPFVPLIERREKIISVACSSTCRSDLAPNGARPAGVVAIGLDNGLITVVTLAESAERSVISKDIHNEHQASISCLAIDGPLLVSVCVDRWMVCTNIFEKRVLWRRRVPELPISIALSPHVSHIAVGLEAGGGYVFHTTKIHEDPHPFSTEMRVPLTALAWVGDSNRTAQLATASGELGTCISVITLGSPEQQHFEAFCTVTKLHSITNSHQTRFVAAFGERLDLHDEGLQNENSAAVIRCTSKMEIELYLRSHTAPITHAAVCPNGHFYITGCTRDDDPTVRLWTELSLCGKVHPTPRRSRMNDVEDGGLLDTEGDLR